MTDNKSTISGSEGDATPPAPRWFIDGFVAFIGNGENKAGRFPANLTELNDALREFIAATPSGSLL